MKILAFFSFIAVTSVVFLFSCVGEEMEVVKNKANEQEKKLFNRIPLTPDDNGTYAFLHEKSKIQKDVVKLFTLENQLLTRVDDFGLGKDDSGESYFYVKEVTEQLTRSIFVYLKNDDSFSMKNNSDKNYYASGIECANARCCDECVVNNDSCVCHTINRDCMKNGETLIACTTRHVNIQISQP